MENLHRKGSIIIFDAIQITDGEEKKLGIPEERRECNVPVRAVSLEPTTVIVNFFDETANLRVIPYFEHHPKFYHGSHITFFRMSRAAVH